MLHRGDGEAAGVGLVPGRGGVTRGRGDAPMIWGEEPAERRELFAAEALPSARSLDPDHAATVGIGASAPRADSEEEAAAPAGSRSPAESAAWSRRLAPRHRAAVRRFFATGEGD